jgi:hypothetical protein
MINNPDLYSARMFVFIDESHKKQKDIERREGKSPIGGPAIAFRHNDYINDRTSAIVSLTLERPLTCDIFDTIQEAIDSPKFIDTFDNSILPFTTPYPGERSVIILDNAYTHHKDILSQECLRVCVLIFFLPPYSPDLNPIEKVFNITKKKIQNLYGINRYGKVYLENV